MEARIQWVSEVMLFNESGSDHVVVMDGPLDHGGRNLEVRPMEMVLIGLGGCINFGMISILREMHQPVGSYEASFEAERADEESKMFTKIRVHSVVKGRGLKETQVERAVELSAEKHYSASTMFDRGGVEVTHNYEIVELN